MKAILITALALGACAAPAAYAAANDDVMARLAALEKENAAIRKENAVLRENKTLRIQNAALKSAAVPAASSAPNAKRDPYAAYAADLPMAYKVAPMEAAGQLRIWGEGGAVWSGGDVLRSNYSLTPLVGFAATSAGSFDLKPKLGWQAAAGFDYRFAGSPWHVSGQFRYGESGRVSGSAAAGGPLDPALAAVVVAPGSTVTATEAFAVGHKESHWLADGAIGYDVLGAGHNAMQIKAGLRVAEVVGKTNSLDQINVAATLAAPRNFAGAVISGFAISTTSDIETRSAFLGAGPRIGVEGSVPLAGGWALDYAGDAAVLFGRQRLTTTTVNNSAVSPAVLAIAGGGLIGGPITGATTVSDERYATVFNADLQVGVSYWLTEQVKLSASYRLDAYFNVLNQTFGTTTNQTIDRYVHGPRLGVSATF